jgi:hypothetical protein
MPSSGMLRRVTFVRIDVSEERTASITRLKGISELGKMLAVTVAVCFSCHLLLARLARGFLSDDGGDRFLRNVGSYKTHAASHSRRRNSL